MLTFIEGHSSGDSLHGVAVTTDKEMIRNKIDGKIEQNSEYLTFLSFNHEVLLVFS